MKILFAIAVLSFVALLWTALASMRHVRRNSARAAAQPVPDTHISEALDIRLSEIARLASSQRDQGVAAGTQQDFSYFTRDVAATIPDKMPYAGPSPTTRTAADLP